VRRREERQKEREERRKRRGNISLTMVLRYKRAKPADVTVPNNGSCLTCTVLYWFHVFIFGISDITMGKVPKKPVQVSTPGSYSASKILKAKARAKTKGKSKGKSKAKSRTVQNTTPSKASKKKGKGRPSSASDRRPRKTIKARSSYTEVDLLEAVRLVVEEDFSISCAAQHLNDVKTGVVPRMTLSDRLKKEEPTVKPVLGRPQECYRTFILLYLYIYNCYRTGTGIP
jgi:hypothetical protein